MIRVAIAGYGNLGKGVESALLQNEDMKLTHVFTRRNPESLNISTEGVKKCSLSDIASYKNDIDVLVICGGSATDLPELTPALAKDFNVIDSFDTHANIPIHFDNVNKAALEGNKVALISAGWDPGMFSLMRLYSDAILPEGNHYTFWGKGVSQGHSDAIRRINGVKDARQYTIPVPSAVEAVLNGENPTLTTRQKHTRECFVVAEEGADLAFIEKSIKEMPNYFADYDTTVHFISEEELLRDHAGLPHGGIVVRSGVTGLNKECKSTVSYKLTTDSNPQFTGSVIVAFARAIYRLSEKKEYGCKTVFDIPPVLLSSRTYEEILHSFL